MSKLSDFFSFILMLGIFNLLWNYLILPLLINGPIEGISNFFKDSDEDFSFIYVLKIITRYLFWASITTVCMFFVGPIVLKILDYIVFDKLISIIKDFIGIS